MPSYKLTYFDTAGRAEAARLLFKYGNIPFVDGRIKTEDWPKVKQTTPYGQLPVLEIDGEKVGQSLAIFRYIANEVGLAGKDNKENLAIDSVVYVFEDIDKLSVVVIQESDEKQKKEKLEKYKESVQFYLKKLEEGAKKNGGYLALPRLTWAEVFFVTAYERVRSILQGEDILAPYPNLQKVKKHVLSQDSIKNWIKVRPPSPMGPVKMVYDLKEDL